MTQPPPGWYPDPGNPSQSRWWDGRTWSGHTAPAAYRPWTPARRRRIWPWIVGAVGGALLLLGVCAAIAVPRIVGTFKHPVDAANIYLADLRDERLPAAYAQLCVVAYGGVSYDQYVERVRAEEAQRGHITRFNAHRVHRVAGHGNEAIVDIDVTTTRGPDAIQARMVNESGHWHWCGSRPAPK